MRLLIATPSEIPIDRNRAAEPQRLRPAPRAGRSALCSAVVALALTLWLGNCSRRRRRECPVAGGGGGRRSTPRRSASSRRSTAPGEGRGYADMAFKDAAGQAGDHRRFRRQEAAGQFLGQLVRAVPGRNAGARCAGGEVQLATTSWCCRSISISARAGSRRRRAFLADEQLAEPAALRRPDLRGLRAAEAAGGGDRAAGDAAARREGLRAGGAAGPGGVGLAGRRTTSSRR